MCSLPLITIPNGRIYNLPETIKAKIVYIYQINVFFDVIHVDVALNNECIPRELCIHFTSSNIPKLSNVATDVDWAKSICHFKFMIVYISNFFSILKSKIRTLIVAINLWQIKHALDTPEFLTLWNYSYLQIFTELYTHNLIDSFKLFLLSRRFFYSYRQDLNCTTFSIKAPTFFFA